MIKKINQRNNINFFFKKIEKYTKAKKFHDIILSRKLNWSGRILNFEKLSNWQNPVFKFKHRFKVKKIKRFSLSRKKYQKLKFLKFLRNKIVLKKHSRTNFTNLLKYRDKIDLRAKKRTLRLFLRYYLPWALRLGQKKYIIKHKKKAKYYQKQKEIKELQRKQSKYYFEPKILLPLQAKKKLQLLKQGVDVSRLPYFVYNFQRLFLKNISNFSNKNKKYLRIRNSFKRFIFRRKKNEPYIKSDFSDLYKSLKVPYFIGKIIFRFKHNNIFVNLSTQNNKLLYTTSAGACGYKGPKRSTPFAREKVSKNVADKALLMNYKMVDLFFKFRPNKRYFHVIKGLSDTNLTVRLIYAHKNNSHGYVRAKKKRRL